MLYGLLTAAISAANARGGRIADRKVRDRRRDPEAPPEAPNPDFDFGAVPSSLALAKPTAAERRLSRVLFFLALLALAPLGFLLVFLFLP